MQGKTVIIAFLVIITVTILLPLPKSFHWEPLGFSAEREQGQLPSAHSKVYKNAAVFLHRDFILACTSHISVTCALWLYKTYQYGREESKRSLMYMFIIVEQVF